jgi:soluble lytic murein transglycosylase-like protein/LysM repeat protein
MWTRTHILILSMAASLLPGCTSLGITLVDSVQPGITSAEETQGYSFPPNPSLSVEVEPATASSPLQVEMPQAGLSSPAAPEPISTFEHSPVAKPDNQEAQAVPATAQSNTSAVRNVPALNAHDRLFDLLQKDIDKAMGQTSERRRLHFSRAVIENSRVRNFINQFSKSNKESFSMLLARSGRYMPMIAKVLREEGLPEEFAYLALIESGFSPHAASPNGAVGLWQFVAGTARTYGLRIDSWVDERRDPLKSTRAAAAYLKDLHEYFGKWYLATAAYNAGQGAIDKAVQAPGAKNVWGVSEKAKLREETRNFVPKFVAVSLIATNPGEYGFGDILHQEPLEYEEVELRGSLRLDAIANMVETSLEVIQELNPALIRNSTPPENDFTVKLPAGKGLAFTAAYEQLNEKNTEPIQVMTHKVRRGETLISIARRYGQHVRTLMELNGLSSPRLRIGQPLKVIIEGLRGGLR